jgi:hypothetical protein
VAQSSALNVPPATQSHESSHSTNVLGSPVPELGNAKPRSVRPYGSIILIAAFLLFTLILIRPTYVARYVGTSTGSVHVE